MVYVPIVGSIGGSFEDGFIDQPVEQPSTQNADPQVEVINIRDQKPANNNI